MSRRGVAARVAAGAGGAAAAAWFAPVLVPRVRPLARAMGVPLRLPLDGAVAITFDDGPHPEGTPAMLEALAAAGARATFFLVGEQVERDPALAREIAAAGHGVALHAHRHRLQLRLTPGAFEDDLARGHAVVADATGAEPVFYRPPYGKFSWTGLAAVRRRGLEPVLWSRWGLDWTRRARPESIAELVTRDLAAGDVLLLHDADTYCVAGSHRRTAAALPRILAEVERRGLATAAL